MCSDQRQPRKLMQPEDQVARDDFLIRPAKNVTGAVRLPGDKSISHRYAMLGAAAVGTTRLRNFSTGADCASTLAALSSLGVEIRRGSQSDVEIEGCVW